MEPVPVRCRVPTLLKRIGKDQQWLADVTGKSKSQISDYCTLRKVMNIRTAVLIAHYLTCTLDDIYVWEFRQ
ncbi:helix-turn-helix transcriptional regulator [Paenibacillus sp. MY03]|uniref:helix-turn-helix domain-containing protein n=1 Tax=Paenibacillus sp. MY03 TaxID=302980 RepID=UPI00118157EC